MENDKAQSEVDKLDESVSYRGGFNFDFKDGCHNINIRCSSVTGKESVFFDDQLMVEKRSFKRKSSMEFRHEDNRYEIEFDVVDMLKGETHCTLIKNDVHVKTIKKALLKKNQLAGKDLWLKLPIHFAIGATCGYLAVKYLPLMFGG